MAIVNMLWIIFILYAVGVTSLSQGQDEGARQRYRHKSTLLDLIDRNVDLRMKTDISRQQQDRRLARELVSLLLGKGSVSRQTDDKSEKRSCIDWWCADQKATSTTSTPTTPPPTPTERITTEAPPSNNPYQALLDYLRRLLGARFNPFG